MAPPWAVVADISSRWVCRASCTRKANGRAVCVCAGACAVQINFDCDALSDGNGGNRLPNQAAGRADA